MLVSRALCVCECVCVQKRINRRSQTVLAAKVQQIFDICK